MVYISGMTISEGTEELKGQPFLLNVFEERTCAASIREVIKTRNTERTLIGRKVSCRDIASLDTRLYQSQEFVGSRGHWVRQGGPRVHLQPKSALSLLSKIPEVNLLTPYSSHVLSEVKLRERFHD